jgi:hypothetical protein
LLYVVIYTIQQKNTTTTERVRSRGWREALGRPAGRASAEDGRHEKHAIDEAPAGIDRKAAWLRGASQRKPANPSNSRPPGEPALAASDGKSRRVVYRVQRRKAARPAASWPARAGRRGRPAKTAYKGFFRGRRGLGLANGRKTQPRAPCAAVKPFSTQGVGRGRLCPSLSGPL